MEKREMAAIILASNERRAAEALAEAKRISDSQQLREAHRQARTFVVPLLLWSCDGKEASK